MFSTKLKLFVVAISAILMINNTLQQSTPTNATDAAIAAATAAAANSATGIFFKI